MNERRSDSRSVLLGASVAACICLMLHGALEGPEYAHGQVRNPSVEGRYQISSISPGDVSSIYQAFVLDSMTGRVYALLKVKDAARYDRELAAKNDYFRFVWRPLAEGPK